MILSFVLPRRVGTAELVFFKSILISLHRPDLVVISSEGNEWAAEEHTLPDRACGSSDAEAQTALFTPNKCERLLIRVGSRNLRYDRTVRCLGSVIKEDSESQKTMHWAQKTHSGQSRVIYFFEQRLFPIQWRSNVLHRWVLNNQYKMNRYDQYQYVASYLGKKKTKRRGKSVINTELFL